MENRPDDEDVVVARVNDDVRPTRQGKFARALDAPRFSRLGKALKPGHGGEDDVMKPARRWRLLQVNVRAGGVEVRNSIGMPDCAHGSVALGEAFDDIGMVEELVGADGLQATRDRLGHPALVLEILLQRLLDDVRLRAAIGVGPLLKLLFYIGLGSKGHCNHL